MSFTVPSPARTLKFLVAESEPPEARARRRDSVGRSSGETYLDLLRRLVPDAACDRIKPADDAAPPPGLEALAGYDAVFLTGSPLHVWQDRPEVRRQIEFMRAVYDSGTPAFGSCAGLQVACVAAGGRVRSMGDWRESGFARRIAPTDAGRGHALLVGRPLAYDAPAIHTDAVEALPAGATLLASNAATEVQAAEIRLGTGIFWGVQYHPEIDLAEVAAALRRQSDDLVGAGLVGGGEAVEAQAALVDALHADPDSRELAWRLGLDAEVTDPERRTRELRNFVDRLVLPTRSARGRG